ncbi:MAG: hypothetical protein K2H68_04240 [Bacteroidales bacterium]|nr:hypothetical protein [Bacteroidales bacterium]
MKNFFALILFALCVSFCYAQEATEERKVTTFLGIPVDGSKSEMIRKLEQKGYQYNNNTGFLSGEYNGEDVIIAVQTNNNKVWRIAIADAKNRNEGQIKIRYNNLCKQFSNNKRYGSITDQTIPESEDISYEMLVNKKQYQAIFFQDAKILTDTLGLHKLLKEKYTEEQLNNPTEEQRQEIMETSMSFLSKLIDARFGFENRTVWFTIDKAGSDFSITMFYENNYNQANGEDL